MATELTTNDKNTLSACETDIERGGRLVATAFETIKEKKLYRAYGTFEDYCKERWGITDRHARRIASHNKVIANLTEAGIQTKTGPMGPEIPERATREIADLPPETQVEVVEAATKDGKKPTAENVREAREEVSPKQQAVRDFFDDKGSKTAADPQGQANQTAGSRTNGGKDGKDSPAAGSKRRKPTEKNPAKLVDGLITKHYSPLCRGIDDVAEMLGWRRKTKRVGNHAAANDALTEFQKAMKELKSGNLGGDE